MQIAVIGLGYVGLVTATCLARLGQQVMGLEVDAEKLRSLEQGDAPYYEPHLQPELTLQQLEGRLHFTLDPSAALRDAEVVLVCVGTPSARSGEADLSAVDAVFGTLGAVLDHRAVVVLRSTVPVGTTREAERRLNGALSGRGLASAGAGARESGVPAHRTCDRGLSSPVAGDRRARGARPRTRTSSCSTTLYRPLEAPILVVDAESAELTKNAANAYLATRISFINELAMLCDATGATVDDVLRGYLVGPPDRG